MCLLLPRAGQLVISFSPFPVVVVPDLPIAASLRQQVEGSMERCWISTRRQLLFYLFSCICITLNYTLSSLASNLYRYLQQPQEQFEIVLRK